MEGAEARAMTGADQWDSGGTAERKEDDAPGEQPAISGGTRGEELPSSGGKMWKLPNWAQVKKPSDSNSPRVKRQARRNPP